MKCINKKLGILIVLLAGCMFCTSCGSSKDRVASFETEHFNKSVYAAENYTKDICVVSGDVNETGFSKQADFIAGGLFDLTDNEVLYAENLHKRVFPASTTKILTAYIALKYGNLDDIATVSQNAVEFAADAAVCNLQAGDQLTLEALLNGLLLASGNDCAVAIAEHISGSVEAFAELMNEEAYAIGATQSHFVTPNGLHDDDHYMTAYDLYLIFSRCIQNEDFMDIISKKSYTASISNPSTGTRTDTWEATNFYSAGLVSQPDGVTVIGGKTGYTGEAGNCLILYSLKDDKPYVSVIMGAETKPDIYANMTPLLESAS